MYIFDVVIIKFTLIQLNSHLNKTKQKNRILISCIHWLSAIKFTRNNYCLVFKVRILILVNAVFSYKLLFYYNIKAVLYSYMTMENKDGTII